MIFRNIVLNSLLIAIVAGAAFSFYQQYMVTPIILEAEKYEIVETGHPVMHEKKEVWSPEDGLERTSFTFGANFLAAFGFSMLLVCGMMYAGRGNLINGLLWGCAGYLVFFIAPGLGLNPEIPGMESADLEWRQLWWVMTVIMTAAGLAILVYGEWSMKAGGVVLLVIPHVIGAPISEVHGFAHPDANAVKILEGLWQQFLVQTYIANALLWIIMGVLSGLLVERSIDSLENC